MSAKLKRVLITNLPYLLFFWLLCKLGAGWRLAVGVDASAKALHLLGGMTTVLYTPLFDFHPQDLLIGLIGTAKAIMVLIESLRWVTKPLNAGCNVAFTHWGEGKAQF